MKATQLITPDHFKKTFFLPGNVPSLKNSRQGKFMSKTCRAYLRSFGIQNMSAKAGITGYKTRLNTFIDHIPDDFREIGYPAWIGFYFVRSSKRRFDFHNAVQILADLLVCHDYMPDDDCNHFLPLPVMINESCWHKDKNNSGVYIYYDINAR